MKRAYANRDLTATMDVERDYHRIYQLTVLYDFPTDARLGLTSRSTGSSPSHGSPTSSSRAAKCSAGSCAL